MGAVCAVGVTTGAAAADEEPSTFGAAGTVVLGGAFNASYSKFSDPGSGATTSSRAIGTSIRGDLFVTRNVSLGLAGVISSGKSTTTPGNADYSYRSVVGGAAVRLGYYIPIGGRVGLWPMAAAAIEHADVSGDGQPSLTGDVKTIKLLANILFHVDRGWFLSLTPGFVAYSRSTSGVGLGYPGTASAELGFGGYF